MERQLPVFVYGSLLNGFENYQRYVKPYQHERFAAKTRGRLYHLPDRGYPAFVCEQEGEAWVYGELLYFLPDIYEQALAGLDKLEDFYLPLDERNEYEREAVMISRIDTGEQVEAYLYVASRRMEEVVASTGLHVADGDWRRFMGSK